MRLPRADLLEAMQDLAVAAAEVANYCDHAEHNESTEIADVRRAAKTLRSTAVGICLRAACEPTELYAERLAAIETKNVACTPESFNGAAAARAAGTLRDLQLVQLEHDRAYHADVVGLTKSDQLRHYALHLAKLAGATAAVARGDLSEQDWLKRRVPDMLLFSIKLATVTAECLPETALSELTVHKAPLRSAA
jgi:hypothetical protein